MMGNDRMRGFSGRAALVGAMLACGAGAAALAQKPAPLGAPEGTPPGGKPPAIGQAPPTGGAAQAQPGARLDKFGLPLPPPAATAPPPASDKFAAPQAPGPERPAAPSAPPPAAPPPVARPAPAPPPADELETVRLFRELLGAEVSLSYAQAESIDPARGAVRLRQVVLERPESRAGIAEMTLDGLTRTGVTELLLRGLVVEETGPDPDRVTIDRLRIAGLSVNRPADGSPPRPDMLSVDAVRIEGLSVAGDTPAALASLTLEDYGPGRHGRVALEGLELRQPGEEPVDRVSLGRLTIRGVDLAALMTALVAREAPPQTTGSAALEAEELVLGQGSRRVGGLAALSLTSESPPPGATGVETGRLALRGISVEPFPGLAEWMQRFGYQSLVGDLTADVRVDRAAGRFEIGSLSLAAREIGALGFSVVLEGLSPDDTSPEAMLRARLVSMRLRYLDQSLYGRFVRMQAQQSRRSEQQVREELAGQARALFEAPGAAPRGGGKGGGSAGGGGASAEIGAAIQRFLRGQAREIEFSARPARPVPLTELQQAAPGGPDAVQRALGLTVTTR